MLAVSGSSTLGWLCQAGRLARAGLDLRLKALFKKDESCISENRQVLNGGFVTAGKDSTQGQRFLCKLNRVDRLAVELAMAERMSGRAQGIER